MAKISTSDFDYYKRFIKDSMQAHQSQMKDINTPEEVVAGYEGRLFTGDIETETAGQIIEDHLFIAVNTILPSLFFQIPRPIIKAKREDLNFSATVIESLLKNYFNDDIKRENQMCILDAFLPYGFGVMRVGYNSRRRKFAPSLFTGKTAGQEQNIESSGEYLMYERPIWLRHSPQFTYLDHTQPFGKGQSITFEFDRNLQQLIDSNLYQLPTNFVNYFSQKNEDKRESKIKIKEFWTMIEGFAWKLVYTDDWAEPLSWAKTFYRRLPVELFRFNKAPDRLYPVSHGLLAHNAQKELNYLNELWKKHVDKTRRQHLIWKEAITEDGLKTLEANEIDGLVTTTQPVTAGVHAAIGAQPMSADVFSNIENVRGYLKLLLSTTGGRGGEPDTKLATTERQRALGDFMRTGGLQDDIRDFARGQIKQIISHIVRFGSPELTIRLTGKNITDPLTGEDVTGKDLVIGGERGFSLEELIQGDVENDFMYDVDITSAARPDFAVVRKQLMEAITLAVQIRPLLQEKGQDVDLPELLQDYFNTFDALPNPEKYVINMTDEERRNFIQRQSAEQIANQMKATQPKAKVPSEKSLEQSATAIPTGGGIGGQI